jgi:osmoprotectant transport system ATP-binding protein
MMVNLIKNVTASMVGKIRDTSLDLEIKKGDFSVFIGSSGSGKTATLKMINCLIE